MKQNLQIGHAFLPEKQKLNTIPKSHSSRTAQTGTRSEIMQDELVEIAGHGIKENSGICA